MQTLRRFIDCFSATWLQRRGWLVLRPGAVLTGTVERPLALWGAREAVTGLHTTLQFLTSDPPELAQTVVTRQTAGEENTVEGYFDWLMRAAGMQVSLSPGWTAAGLVAAVREGMPLDAFCRVVHVRELNGLRVPAESSGALPQEVLS